MATPRPRFQLSLRTVLVTLLVGLLLVTVGAIGGLAFVTRGESIRDVIERHFAVVSTATAREVQSVLAPAGPILEELRTRARRGLLPLDDPEALGEQLAERLRYQQGLAWLSYSDHQTGRFVGAWRRADGTIILNRSSPDVDGGRPSEVVIGVDGRRAPYEREVRGGYDPRRQEWYARAVASDGVIWTPPFEFNEGLTGITAALALRQSGTSEPLGVFTADFFLDDISHFLATMTIGRTGRAFVLSRDGAVVAGPPAPIAGQLDPPLQAALALLPNGLADLPTGSPVSLQFEHGRIGYAAAFQAFTVAGGTEWVTAIVMPDDEFLGVVYGNLRSAAGIGLLAVLAAVALGSVVAYRIAAPLRVVAEDLEQAGQFKFSTRPPRASHVREVATLASSAETMKASLRSFGHYVPTEIVQDLLASGREARLGGETRCLTIHFSDVQGFVKIGEGVEPARLVRDLSDYLRIMSDTLREHRGTVDKFLGDGILAFFNAPTEVPDHAALACRAAVRAQERLRELRAIWAAEGRPPFRARIGLHTGEALVGNIGTPDRFEYTVIGDAVNLASRLEELNKLYGTRILTSQDVRDAAGDGFEWRLIDCVSVVGRTSGTQIWELLGEEGGVGREVLRARDVYEWALAAYFERRFAEAAAGFRVAAETLPRDRSAALMARRCESLRHDPPPPDWTGVHRWTTK